MAYEIDAVGSTATEKDYDAWCFRYVYEGHSHICVYDGGTAEVGDDLSKHLRKYYTNGTNDGVEMAICSHPDTDHSSGLRSILENFNVKYLVMNRPWLYIDELHKKLLDDSITKEKLEKKLREQYPFIDELEKIANKRGTTILQGLQGEQPLPGMRIMSPTKSFYLDCIARSDKTPDMKSSAVNSNASILAKLAATAKNWLVAIWGVDNIKEGVTTTPENESSIIIKVKPTNENPFLLVGDAGCESLGCALDYGNLLGEPLSECDFLQIPHHGGRHNVSPSILNKLIGPMISQEAASTKTAFVSVSKNSDHPKKCVTNAFINRGCAVYISSTNTIWHHSGDVKDRGWGKATKVEFSPKVESWDE